MTEAELDHVHELREKIEAAVTDLVDKMTAHEPPHIDGLIRVQLTENYRFWRQ